MRLDDLPESGNIEDRRGETGRRALRASGNRAEAVVVEPEHPKPAGDDQMTQRMDFRAVVPDGYAALLNVEKYLQKSGLDRRLVVLVQMRASQINGCAYCIHMHTREARGRGESEERLYLLDAWRLIAPKK